ncbi:pyruvoyl-dependent arginine decarboxylase [Candidatus Woesearchaeota archaeon]|nr:pyruvoyl-dependent arginine decarboxylase [Candidatus Woesearchaeota archaeon]
MAKQLVVGNRIPKDFFITKGTGESDITVHAGSFHLALCKAGIERYNILIYSSILPRIARKVKKPKEYVHGAVSEVILARADVAKGERATAGMIVGWLYDKKTGKKFGGLVCEYGGSDSEERAKKELHLMLNELYVHGFSEKYDLQEVQIISTSFVPNKRYGTALVALCFVNYVYPLG